MDLVVKKKITASRRSAEDPTIPEGCLENRYGGPIKDVAFVYVEQTGNTTYTEPYSNKHSLS